ncbi:MAG: hypothetical protein ACR2P4_08580 [Gammaproteobacteria bacterium]
MVSSVHGLAGVDPTERIAGTGTSSNEGNEFELGTQVELDDGRVFVYVHANGAIVAGDVVLVDETWEADQIDTTNSATGFGQRVGVATAAFADNDFGWLQINGVVASINVGTSAATNVQLNSTATAGRIDDDATAGSEDVLGIATTGAESSNLAAGFLSYPTVGATN